MRYRFKCLSAADYHSLSQIEPPFVVVFSSLTPKSSVPPGVGFTSTGEPDISPAAVAIGTANVIGF